MIPLGKKDKFNRTTPDHDAANYGKYVTDAGAGGGPERAVRHQRPGDDRTDIVQALLQGIPGLNQHSGAQRRHAG